MERTNFDEIQNLLVQLVRPDFNNPNHVKYIDRGYVLIKRDDEIIGFIQMGDLFDADGNYFEF